MRVHRRRFLVTAAASFAAGMLLPRGRASEFSREPRRRSIKKGFMLACFGGDLPLLEKLKTLKEAGFDGVEVMSHMNQEEVLKARDATGLDIPSVCCSTHWGQPLSHPSPEVRAKGLAGLKTALHDAKRYGARSVLFVPAVVNADISYQDAYERSHAEIAKVVPLAEELEVKIAIENVWNGFLLSPLEAARYVDELKSPWVAWHFDVGNVINFGWPEQWIRVLGKRIVQLHIKEYSRKRRDGEGLWKGFDVDYLDGDNGWPSVMKALDEVGYQGYGIAEPPGKTTPEELRHVARKMDQIFAL